MVQFIPPPPPDLIPSSDLRSTAIINSHPSPSKPNISTINKTAPAVKVVFCSRSPNIISVISSAAIKTTKSPTSTSDSLSSLVDTSFGNLSDKLAPLTPPASTNNTVSASSTALSGSSVAISVTAVSASVAPISGNKSKYELIREDIIAERNAQLKAMGFFEDFEVLRSGMKPKRPLKEKKNSLKHKEKCERECVRRSERLFLSSP